MLNTILENFSSGYRNFIINHIDGIIVALLLFIWIMIGCLYLIRRYELKQSNTINNNINKGADKNE